MLCSAGSDYCNRMYCRVLLALIFSDWVEQSAEDDSVSAAANVPP